jgi:hypothetical protein
MPPVKNERLTTYEVDTFNRHLGDPDFPEVDSKEKKVRNVDSRYSMSEIMKWIRKRRR